MTLTYIFCLHLVCWSLTMMFAQRGPAYGFKLQSLDTLGDTKSSDKRCSLLHFIVDTIREKFPELRNFDTELLHVDKAAMGKGSN